MAGFAVILVLMLINLFITSLSKKFQVCLVSVAVLLGKS